MADDDIQLNFAAFSPPKPAVSKPAPQAAPRAREDSKKRARPTSNLSEIRSGTWQKKDMELQKARKSAFETAKAKRNTTATSSPASTSGTSAESRMDTITTDKKEEKQSSADTVKKSDDLSQFEPAHKKSKPLTSKQKLKQQETNYATYVKEQQQEAKKTAPTEKKKGIVYQTVSELGQELDIFSDKTFSDLDLEPHLVSNITEYMELEKPTQIQRYSIPVLISRRDTLIKAQTGSGKTLAYLIPIVQDIINQTRKSTPTTSAMMDVDEDEEDSTSASSDDDSVSDDEQESASEEKNEEDGERESDEEDDDEESEEENPQATSGRVTKYRAGSTSTTGDAKKADKRKSDGDKSKSARRAPKLNLERSTGTHAIIISPTRELSLQIYDVLRRLLRPFPQIVPGVIMGGEKRKSEKARLRKGVSILVATPGRLVDHLLHTQAFHFDKCRWLVLDEADRLLDMGFERDLTSIITTLNEKRTFSRRQTVLASATLNRDVNRLALVSLIKPVYIAIENPTTTNQASSSVVRNEDEMDEFDSNIPEDDRAHEIPASLKQHVVVVDDKRKLITLISIIRTRLKKSGSKIIVFFSNCDSVDFYYMLFSMVEVGVSLAKGKDKDRERLFPTSLFKLHGNLSQDVRSSTFQAFSACSSGVLLCTDVAARGLDVPAVNWIIQYDVPSDPAAYIHRIGRTARIGSSGDAILLLLQNERPYLDVLTKRQMTFNEISPAEILKDLKVFLEPNPSNDAIQEASSLQHILDKLVESSKQVELKNMAINAFQAFLRSYATHTKTTKHIFHIKNLHLGHLCRNFALRDPPSTFGKTLQNAGLGKKEAQRIKEKAREKERKRLNVKQPGAVTADEFSAM